MRVEYHTRDNRGKYQKNKNIENIYFEDDNKYCYMNIEFPDGKKKRYLLKEI